MKVVEFKGGLGNQMFQYAFYRALLNRGEKVKADIRSYTRHKQHNGYELQKIFGIELDLASAQECVANGFPKFYFADRVLRKLGLNINNKHYINIEGVQALQYLPQLLIDLPQDCYLAGYWQCEKWFSDVQGEVRSSFKFNESNLNDTNKALLDNIRRTNSVSLHVRRGDYNNIPATQNICTLAGYYTPAINFLQERERDLQFFVFSDDVDWCKANLSLDNCCFVDNNSGDASYRDMQLMSCCKHNIIANSTFSWWGAWLNNNPHKLVVAPSRFFNTGAEEHILPAGWIKIGGQEGGNDNV